LNMVVGPNGTGKSSILCAICLGLGGEPRLLGRASEVETFIQNGEVEGYIELELANERGTNPIITRTLRNDGGKKSTFTWNGEAISGKKVREKVEQEFQIQIDNLCTFLPQEKVGSFSGFDSKMLLLETEKTLSENKELYGNHLKLIELQEELHGGDDQVEGLEQKLEQLKVELKRMEREVQRMEQLQHDEELKDLLEKKLLWLKFDQLRDAFATLKEEKEELKQKLINARTELEPLKQAHTEANQNMEEAKKEFETFDKEIKFHQKEMGKQKQKYEKHDDTIDVILGELNILESSRAQLERKIEETRDKVTEIQHAVDTRPASVEDLEAERKRLKAEFNTLHPQYKAKKDECKDLESKMRDIDENIKHSKRKLAKLNDEKENRMRHFFTKEKDAQKAYQWIQSNRKVFRKEVMGPIACEMTPKSNNAAAYLDQHVPNSTLKSFVVQDRADYDLLYQKVRVEQNCPINIIMIDRLPPPKPRMYSDEKMAILKRDHGVLGYLDESLEAPEIVMEALRSTANIQKVLVGTDETQVSMDDRALGEFLAQSEKQDGRLLGYCIFTSDRGKSFKYTSNMSGYSKKLNMRVDDIGPAKILRSGVSDDRKAEAERELKEKKIEYEELLPSFQKAQDELEEIRRTSQEAQSQVKDVEGQIKISQQIINKLNSTKRKLESLEAELGTDDQEDKQRKIDQLNQRVRNSLKALGAHSASYKKLLAATVSASGARLRKEAAVIEERHSREAFEEKKAGVVEIEQDFANLKQRMNQAKTKARQAQQEAIQKAPIEDAEGNELPLKAKVEVDLAQYDTVDLAEAAWEEVEQKIRNTVADRNVIRHYEQKQIEVDSAQDQLDALTKNKEGKATQMREIAEPWEEQLKGLLDKVDQRFSRYMSELGCVGEVKLRRGNGKDEEEPRYEDYGVEIRVSFREGVKPSVLSARVQSGGERSVSTIMYLMAMQDMMVAPFRCVDEINQGLDERNERLVFKRIVENSTKPPGKKGLTDHCGQYWLITPKLLPNLVDMEVEAMNLLFIFNGMYYSVAVVVVTTSE
ncbi:MAG: hypothetical protein SGILL_004744, partial [Bacillariaceae sp.]